LAGTITVGGRVTRPAGLAARATVVLPTWAEEIVTVKVPLAPRVTWLVGGSNETTVGSTDVTVT
jgi:hypothetical protein